MKRQPPPPAPQPDWPPTPAEADVLRAILQQVTIPGAIARQVASLQDKLDRLPGGQP